MPAESAAGVESESGRALPEELKKIVTEAGEEEWGNDVWERIDGVLPGVCNDAYALDWARENLESEDTDLRDLAASLFEASSLELSDQDILGLETLMKEDEDFPGFRAACALAKRLGVDRRIEFLRGGIEDKLKAFADDQDVADIVAEYIELLKEN